MDNEDFEDKFKAMDKWGLSVSSELGGLITDSPAEVLYHYTDINGFLGMISSGSIWATHVTKLNDSTENEIGYSIVRKLLQGSMLKSCKPIFDKVIGGLSSADTYVSCYSTDGDLLSQWRGYTSNSVGYCLGFRTEGMATDDERMPLLEPVIYDEKKACEVVERVIERVNTFVHENSFGEVEVGYLVGWTQAVLNIIACTIKHPKFAEEKEYRHFYQPSKSQLKLEEQFRNGQFGLTPYVTIGFLETNRLPLKNVRIGPCNDFDLESSSLRMLLDTNGYGNVGIFESEIPLRN